MFSARHELAAAGIGVAVGVEARGVLPDDDQVDDQVDVRGDHPPALEAAGTISGPMPSPSITPGR
jgi:hypothetical protein